MGFQKPFIYKLFKDFTKNKKNLRSVDFRNKFLSNIFEYGKHRWGVVLGKQDLICNRCKNERRDFFEK